ncbi:MAG: hypothetical protein ABSG63_06415 [Spirochaetia bacterium]|jgi:hypothetical protein
MKHPIIFAAALTTVALLGALPVFADPWRASIGFEYGSASSTFGLSAPSFTVPVQNNSSSDGIISGSLEYLFARTGPVELGIAAKGSFAISSWNLGAPGVYDGPNYYPYDNVHISADWWALAAMGTAHIHLGRWVTLDGALGYGPYGYANVSYWDDYGLVAGPVDQSSGYFPQTAWGLDWAAGLSFRMFRLLALSLDIGMMGPDFVSGVGFTFPL